MLLDRCGVYLEYTRRYEVHGNGRPISLPLGYSSLEVCCGQVETSSKDFELVYGEKLSDSPSD